LWLGRFDGRGRARGRGTVREDSIAETALKRGDDLLPRPPSDVTCLVKIDVEGSELEVVKGLEWWLTRPRTCFVIAITPDWIRQLGGSSEELLGRFRRLGYGCYLLARKSKFYHSAPILRPMDRTLDDQRDYLFFRADERHLIQLVPGITIG
jgi:hypothetical protein